MNIAVEATPDARTAPTAWRLREEALGDKDRAFALAIHLSPLAGFFILPAVVAPMVLWLWQRRESAFVDDHGRELANALISFAIYHVVAAITVIGIVALPVLYVLSVINVVRGAVAARRGEYFRYPMTIRFLQ